VSEDDRDIEDKAKSPDPARSDGPAGASAAAPAETDGETDGEIGPAAATGGVEGRPGRDGEPADPDAEGDAEETVDPREAAIDLSDLEAEGLDGVVARLRARRDEPDPELDAPPPRRPGRAMWISALVVLLSLPLLGMLWGDFRFWLRSDEPEDLGHVADLVAEGRLGPELFDRYVVLEGTPDVQNALVGTNETTRVGFLRITEAGGRLFAAIPRDVKDKQLNNYDGRYRGRVVPMRKHPTYPWLAQFYDTQSVTVPVDLDHADLVRALGSVGADGTVDTKTVEGQPARLEPDELVRVVVASDDANVQLGAKSFDAAEAEQAMIALGYPFLALDAPPAGTAKKASGRIVHRFVARIPEPERKGAVARLLAGLPEDKRGGNADPAFGATVLQRFSTYVAAVEDIGVRGDALVLPRPTSEALMPYEVSGDRLVPASIAGPHIELRPAAIDDVRVEQRIRVDPDGLLIVVGQEPSTRRLWALCFIVVSGIVLANLVSLALWWRRRAAAPT
jgi:hypothetical protein